MRSATSSTTRTTACEVSVAEDSPPPSGSKTVQVSKPGDDTLHVVRRWFVAGQNLVRAVGSMQFVVRRDERCRVVGERTLTGSHAKTDPSWRRTRTTISSEPVSRRPFDTPFGRRRRGSARDGKRAEAVKEPDAVGDVDAPVSSAPARRSFIPVAPCRRRQSAQASRHDGPQPHPRREGPGARGVGAASCRVRIVQIASGSMAK